MLARGEPGRPSPFGDYGLDQYGNLVGASGMLFIHVAHRYAKVGWQRNTMLTLTFAWLGFAFAYIAWLFWLRAQ